MTDNPESKDGSTSSLPPKLNLRKKIQAPDEQSQAPEAPAPAVRPASTVPVGTGTPLKPRLTPSSGTGAGSVPPVGIKPASPAMPSGGGAGSDSAKTESQTVHIQIPKAPASSAPPVALKPLSGTAIPPSDASQRQGDAPEKKNETSKIPLSAARVEAPTVRSTPVSDGPVKTIRIRPKSATTQTQKVAEPGVLSIGPDMGASKKQTSRISLEAAFATDTESASAPTGSGPRPKTIRLKRPSEASTVKVTPRPQGAEPAPAAAPPVAKLEETSKLELPPAQPMTTSSPTQRKTIRVKRPTQQPGLASPGGSRGTSTIRVASPGSAAGRIGGTSASDGGLPVAVAPVRQDEPSVVFSIFAIAAMLVMMVTIYMFSAQTFGPNASYTQYSYAVEGPNLGWPGKLPPPRQ